MGNRLPHRLGRRGHWDEMLGRIEGKVNSSLLMLFNHAVCSVWGPLGTGLIAISVVTTPR